MLIISQDRRKIFNFENIIYIELEEDNKTIRCQTKDTNCWLGNYKTEDRAKEILQQIAIAYGNIKMINIPSIDIMEEISSQRLMDSICYIMPKE